MRSAVLLMGILGFAEPSTPGSPSWETDWKKAFERARSERRLVFVDYFATWCAPCQEMERDVFPDPRVAGPLGRFVLLRLDADRTANSPDELPTYVLFDPWETERLRFVGFQPAEAFARDLALVVGAEPGMLEAAQSLKEKDSMEGRMRMGTAYMKAHAPSNARDEYKRARKLAARARDPLGAQTAEIAAASTWILEGEAKKTVTLLEKIAQKPEGPECGTLAWLTIGNAKRQMRDREGAVEAYRRALAACPENSPLRGNVETALAAMEAKR